MKTTTSKPRSKKVQQNATKTVAIVHYNTPELTMATIRSIRKNCKEEYLVVVLDNSDERPFPTKLDKAVFGTVKVLNNRKGKIIDFDKEIEKYEERSKEYATVSNYGSVKHMMSVQKLWELIPDGFILMDSDVILRKSIDMLWDEQYAACGMLAIYSNTGRQEKDRLLPMVCYLNVPVLVKNGARYFDPERSWFLQPGGKENEQNWYDTGACLLEDIRNTKPALVAKIWNRLDEYYVHLRHGSWKNEGADRQARWAEMYAEFWK